MTKNPDNVTAASVGTFQAYRVEKTQGDYSGSVQTLGLDDLSQGDVLVKIKYSSVNYKDALASTGKGKIIRGDRRIPGIDAAGKVVESASERFKAGDKVLVTGYDFGTSHDGGYAEYARLPAEWLVPRPKHMNAYTAMAIGTAGFTAALCIQRMEQNGQHPSKGPIVVTGATGGVGSLAIDMLSKLGYEVIALTGKPEKDEFLKALGAHEIIHRQDLPKEAAVLEKAQWGGAIDNVGGDTLSWLTRSVMPWGNIASVGLAGGSDLNASVMPFILRGVSLLGITSSGCPRGWREPLWKRLASDLAPNHLEKIVSNEIGLGDLDSVFDSMLKGKTTGRTVVKISD